MQTYVPPDKGLMAFATERQSSYEDSRWAWAEEIGRPYKKRRNKNRPPPGQLEIQDGELG